EAPPQLQMKLVEDARFPPRHDVAEEILNPECEAALVREFGVAEAVRAHAMELRELGRVVEHQAVDRELVQRPAPAPDVQQVGVDFLERGLREAVEVELLAVAGPFIHAAPLLSAAAASVVSPAVTEGCRMPFDGLHRA